MLAHVLIALLALGSPLPSARTPQVQAAQAQTLTLRDLVNRPDRWPASVALAHEFKFSGGASLKAGASVKVVEFGGATLLVDGGGGLYFDIKPEDCDLLASANALWSQLTPAQRAVEPELLRKDASLLPTRAVCTSGFQLEDGTELAPGGEYDCLGLEGDDVNLYSREHKSLLGASLAQTDVIARARQLVLLEPEKRPARIVEALAKGLVDAGGKAVAGETVAKGKVFVLYYGASWCGPCRKFSPGLVQFVKDAAAENPGLVTVLMSNDEKDADLLEYMSEEKMPWPALPLATLNQTPQLTSYAVGSIPNLVVVDRYGKVLAKTVQNGRYVGPDKALADLKTLLATGIAR